MTTPIWEIVPNFNDAKAKCKEERDELGNITKIEILYGGEGGGDGKGHGHWAAELTDGLFQVVLDREPDKAGGAHKIESIHRSDAYSDESRKERIAQKEQIIHQMKDLSLASNKISVEQIKSLSKEFYAIGSCGRSDNERLKHEFRERQNDAYKKLSRQRTEGRLSAINRRKKQIDDLQRQIEHLNGKLARAWSEDYIRNINQWISEKQMQIGKLNEEISRMQNEK